MNKNLCINYLIHENVCSQLGFQSGLLTALLRVDLQETVDSLNVFVKVDEVEVTAYPQNSSLVIPADEIMDPILGMKAFSDFGKFLKANPRYASKLRVDNGN